jgi:hypothetical protein
MSKYRLPREQWTGRSQIYDGKTGDVTQRMVGWWCWGDGDANDLVAQCRKAYDESLSIVDGVRAKRAEIEGTKKFTALGVTEQLAKFASEDSIAAMRRARARLERVNDAIAEKQAKVVLSEPDPAHEPQRAEMRAMLRSMPAAERQKFVLANTNDPLVRDAIIHASPILSGVGAATHDRMKQDVLQAMHGDVLSEIEDMREIVETVERATVLGREAIRETLGVDRNTFEQIASVGERNRGQLPFKVDREQGPDGAEIEVARVLDIGTKQWRRATSAEIMATRTDTATAAA